MPSPRRSVLTFNLSRLRRELRPFRLYWFPRLRSTNDHAARLRRQGELFAPAVVVTARQIAGRGRGSNRWWSTAGSITATFALPLEEHLAIHQLPLVAGLAVRDALTQLAGLPGIGLQWPNDIVYDGRKLAGLLCERMRRADLVGIGVNLNLDPSAAPRALRDSITSLYAITGRQTDPTDALVCMARHLRGRISQGAGHPFPALLKEYDRYHTLVGREVCIRRPEGGVVRGCCLGLDQMGRLLLRDDECVHHIIAGRVQLL